MLFVYYLKVPLPRVPFKVLKWLLLSQNMPHKKIRFYVNKGLLFERKWIIIFLIRFEYENNTMRSFVQPTT